MWCRTCRVLLQRNALYTEISLFESEMFSTGVTGNEAMNLQLKNLFYGGKMHQAAANHKLSGFQLSRLLNHNCALYRETTTQIREGLLIARVCGSLNPWPAADTASWHAFCHGSTDGRGNQPQFKKIISSQKDIVSDWKNTLTVNYVSRGCVEQTVYTLKKKD